MNPKVAVAQMNCRLGDVQANLRRINKLAQIVSKREADIVCFPELATTGYSLNEKWPDFAEPIPGATTDKLSQIANEFGLYLIAGMPERDSQSARIFDSAVLIDPAGVVLGVYRKVHLWNLERTYFTPGGEFPVFRTRIGTFGIGICYDLEFPEPARIMALNGAELIFFCSAQMKPFERQVSVYVQSRATENGVFVCFSNRIGHEGQTVFFGRSQIVSPGCRILARARASETFVAMRINLTDISRERERLPYLEHRVPSAYGLLAK